MIGIQALNFRGLPSPTRKVADREPALESEPAPFAGDRAALLEDLLAGSARRRGAALEHV